MNNEGWGLTSMLAFCGILFLGFFASLVVARKKFDGLFDEDIAVKLVASFSDLTENSSNYKDDTNKKSKVDYSIIDYSIYEEELKKAGINYYKNSNINKEYVTIKELTLLNYIKEIHDPSNYDNICKGYVIYNNGEYKPYLRCIGSYATKGYDLNYE